MRIGGLARQTGVSPDTIRYYERLGILPQPPREASGYRAYDKAAEARLQFIRDSKLLNLPRQRSDASGGEPQREYRVDFLPITQPTPDVDQETRGHE